MPARTQFRRADGQVASAAIIKVADAGHGAAKAVAAVQHGFNQAFSRGNLLFRINLAIRTQEQHPDCAGVVIAIVVIGCTDRKVGDAIGIQIVDVGNRTAELVTGIQSAIEAAGTPGYFPAPWRGSKGSAVPARP